MEKRLVLKALKRFGRDLLLAFQWLRDKKRYKRTTQKFQSVYGGFKRFAAKIREEKIAKKKAKKKPKLYEGGTFPGQKLQVDVKFVPSECVICDAKYYQYTAVDEYSRWTFREMYDEHSTYSSADFLEKLIKSAPFEIKKIQTDNGTEYTVKKLCLPTPCLSQNQRIKHCSRMGWQDMGLNTSGYGSRHRATMGGLSGGTERTRNASTKR